MDKVAFCISMESSYAWPQSADGRMVKSGHDEDMYGTLIEDDYREPDESISSLNRLDAHGQAAIWRKRVDDRVGKIGAELLRIAYSYDGKRKETACDIISRLISNRCGCSLFEAFDECLHEARILRVERHTEEARSLLLNMMRETIKKAHGALGDC